MIVHVPGIIVHVHETTHHFNKILYYLMIAVMYAQMYVVLMCF